MRRKPRSKPAPKKMTIKSMALKFANLVELLKFYPEETREESQNTYRRDKAYDCIEKFLKDNRLVCEYHPKATEILPSETSKQGMVDILSPEWNIEKRSKIPPFLYLKQSQKLIVLAKDFSPNYRRGMVNSLLKERYQGNKNEDFKGLKEYCFNGEKEYWDWFFWKLRYFREPFKRFCYCPTPSQKVFQGARR